VALDGRGEVLGHLVEPGQVFGEVHFLERLLVSVEEDSVLHSALDVGGEHSSY
jgi:hypothetical protein